MKKLFILFPLFLLLSWNLLSCSKSELLSDLEQSEIAWQQFKINHQNSYEFQLYNQSWTGQTSKTTITVEDGNLVKSKNESFQIRFLNGIRDTIDYISFTEVGQEINSNPEREKLLTLDGYYQQARQLADAHRKDGLTIIEANNNGLLSKAGFVPQHCVDDCFSGVNISYVKGLSQP